MTFNNRLLANAKHQCYYCSHPTNLSICAAIATIQPLQASVVLFATIQPFQVSMLLLQPSTHCKHQCCYRNHPSIPRINAVIATIQPSVLLLQPSNQSSISAATATIQPSVLLWKPSNHSKHQCCYCNHPTIPSINAVIANIQPLQASVVLFATIQPSAPSTNCHNIIWKRYSVIQTNFGLEVR